MSRTLPKLLLSALALVAFLGGAAPQVACAATLAEAVQHWTGRTPDVFGRGAHVTIDLPPAGAFPSVSADAMVGQRDRDPGWQLSAMAIAQPVRLSGGVILTARQQQGNAWLGASTMQTDVAFGGIKITSRDGAAVLDTATLSVTGSAGPVAIGVTLDGLHVPRADPSIAGLMPQHAAIHAHIDQGGAPALIALLDGVAPRGSALTIDQASVTVGPAKFSANGTVRLQGPRDLQGTLFVAATGFKDLLRQMPTAGPATAAYPVLMILRQIGHKDATGMHWTVTFTGDKILVEGLDIAPLLNP